MIKTISKDVPLSEITLRKYEKPYATNKRDLTRKLCLSIGLLQPGDSRDVIVDILLVLLNNRRRKIMMTSEEVKDSVINQRTKMKLPLNGIASSNVRRQLKRLKDLYLIENIKNQYRIIEFENLSVIFNRHIREFYLKNILERVEEYFKEIK
jgi:DNA-binding transcriptional ArsR family regulator